MSFDILVHHSKVFLSGLLLFLVFWLGNILKNKQIKKEPFQLVNGEQFEVEITYLEAVMERTGKMEVKK